MIPGILPVLADYRRPTHRGGGGRFRLFCNGELYRAASAVPETHETGLESRASSAVQNVIVISRVNVPESLTAWMPCIFTERH
jgi:hypothetical protein